MSQKDKPPRSKPGKITLASSKPWKVNSPQPKEIPATATEDRRYLTHDARKAIADVLRSPAPRGDEEYLREALSVLCVKGASYREAEQKLRRIATVYLLNGVNQKGPSINDGHKLMLDIATASALLAARLAQLPSVFLEELRRQSKAQLIRQDVVSQLNNIATAATKMKATLPVRKGGHVTAEAAVLKTFADRKQFGPLDPRDYFLTKAVTVFAEYRGAREVSSTINDTTDCCYHFVRALFRFATGKIFGDQKRFKNAVSQWKTRNGGATSQK